LPIITAISGTRLISGVPWVPRRTQRESISIFLSGSYMVRQLPPWFSNTGKRLVKAPKVFIRDSGVLHALLGLKDRMQIHSHPKLGPSWEGFAIEQIILITGAEKDAYFYKNPWRG